VALLHPAAKARVVGSVDSSVRAAVVSFHQKKISSIENILLDLCAIFSFMKKGVNRFVSSRVEFHRRLVSRDLKSSFYSSPRDTP